MRLSLLATSLALTSLATAQTSFLSEEQRQEIRTLIREEIRAALKEHAAQTTTVKAAPAKTHGATATADPTTGTTKTKAYRITDGKMQEVDLEELRDEHGSFRFLAQRDGENTIHIVKSAEPQGSTRVLTLSPKVVGGDHKVAVVVPEGVEQKVLVECCKALEAAEECCEAVKIAAGKGAGEAESCECAEGKEKEGAVEIEARPAKVKAKKNKKGAKKNKAPKAEKVDAGTELKISEVPEKVSR